MTLILLLINLILITIKGVTRLDRWQWADERKLHPPVEVKTLLLNNPADLDYVNG
jgi:hypothetical protein